MRILKFSLAAYKVHIPYTISAPAGSTFLAFNEQNNRPTIWMACPDGAFDTHYTFTLVYTGSDFPSGRQTYCGLIKIYDGEIVLHLFQQEQEILP